MGKGYQKFRKRMLLASLWRSLLPGFSLALAVFAVLFVLYKRMILPFSPLAAAGIGAGAGFALAAVLFAALFPYKKRLARKLDRELSLREGVQTMLAFADRQDDIMVLQREQTDLKLLATPLKKLKIKHVWTCVVCFVLAIGMTVTAFAIPAKQPEPPAPPVDPPFSLDEWEAVALADLIREVQESTMTESAKTETVIALQTLLDALRETETESRMKSLVVDTVMQIKAISDSVVTLRSFAPILAAGGSAYARELNRAMEIREQAAFAEALNKIAASINEDEEFDVAIHVLSEELKMALRNSGASEQDPLYIELERLANTLANVAAKLQDYTLTWGRMQVTDAFGVAYTQIGKALAQQRYDADMSAHVEARLLEIFGLSVQDLPGQEQGEGPQNPGDYEDDDDDQTITDGGMGSGELILGSQDVIYDPNSDQYVKYSEVIHIYNAIFLEKKVDGALGEEIAALIESYFAALFSPSNKD